MIYKCRAWEGCSNNDIKEMVIKGKRPEFKNMVGYPFALVKCEKMMSLGWDERMDVRPAFSELELKLKNV